MTVKEFYEEIKGDYQEVLKRLPSESFVKKLVKKYAEDGSCDQLVDSVEKDDWETAFRMAHTMKGIALNLGFDQLYQTSNELTEALRGAKPLENYDLLEAVKKSHESIMKAIAKVE